MTHPLLPQRPLDGIRILVLVGDDYEDLELWYPKLRIEEAGGQRGCDNGAAGDGNCG